MVEAKSVTVNLGFIKLTVTYYVKVTAEEGDISK